jgi:hypothetical protein
MRPRFDRSAALVFLLPAIFCLVGLCLLAPAAWTAYQSWAFLRAAQSAPGSVIALDWQEDSDTSLVRPVVRYEIRGDPHQINGATWASSPAYVVGQQVQVLYPPDQPSAARLYTWFDFWFLPALLGGIGAVFELVGLGIGYAIWRSLR